EALTGVDRDPHNCGGIARRPMRKHIIHSTHIGERLRAAVEREGLAAGNCFRANSEEIKQQIAEMIEMRMRKKYRIDLRRGMPGSHQFLEGAAADVHQKTVRGGLNKSRALAAISLRCCIRSA